MAKKGERIICNFKGKNRRENRREVGHRKDSEGRKQKETIQKNHKIFLMITERKKKAVFWGKRSIVS